MMGWYGGGWGVGQWAGMGLGMLLFWGVVIALVVLVLRRPGQRHEHHHHEAPHSAADQATALRILDERFARGDLDQDEYRTRRAVLQDR